MKRYRELTMGKTLIMGRKTWESIPEQYRPLPGRTNVVLSQSPSYRVPEGVFVYPSLEQALHAHAEEDIVINGGASLYNEMLDHVDMLHITEVHQDIDGDTFFPEINSMIWQEIFREDHDLFSFVTYQKQLDRIK
jgi:dihydrofolate reductase